MGRTLAARGRSDEAITLLDRAWSILEHASVAPGQRAETAFALATASWSTTAHRERALDLAREALSLYRDLGDRERATEVETWLNRNTR